jgi:SAM-dependent MidA family methyltransferase
MCNLSIIQKFKNVRTASAKVASVVTLGVVSSAASAAGLSDLTAAVSFTDVVTGVLAVAGALVSVYVMIKGVKFIMSMVKSG